GRAHHDRTDLEWNLIGEREYISAGSLDELRVSTVEMFADHLSAAAKLFQPANAELTPSAVCQIMYADSIAACDLLDIGAGFLDPTCDFVPKRYRQTVNPGNAGAIMFVGMADPARRNP